MLEDFSDLYVNLKKSNRAKHGTEEDQDGGWHQKRKHICRDEGENGESRRGEGRVIRSLPVAVHLDTDR